MSATTTNTTPVFSSVKSAESAIVGGWYAGDSVVTFLPNGTYFHAQVHTKLDDPYDDAHTPTGIEFGTYSWNSSTGKFSATPLIDTNGLTGFSNLNAAEKIQFENLAVVGDTLNAGDFSVPCITSTTNPIVGSWSFTSTDSGDFVNGALTFLNDGTYFLAEAGHHADPTVYDGMERGIYSWDSVSGAFNFQVLIDTNGNAGFSDSPNLTKITLADGKMTFENLSDSVAAVVTSTEPVISANPTDGNDSITGTNGNDTLDGGLGSDTLTGGNGDDLYIVDNAGDKIVEMSFSGIDTVLSKISYTLGNSLENLGLLGSANITAIGNEFNNALSGNDGNNTLNGMAGNDALSGGKGSDKLTGGKGVDIFKFNDAKETGITLKTRDTITDFNHNEKDKIDLSAIDANAKLAGDQAFKFIGSKNFSKDATAELRFDAASHILYGSTNADSKAEFSIQLNGVSSLVAGDFVL